MVLADRYSRRLIFSLKAKEKEELVEKKKSLMVRKLYSLKLAIFLLNVYQTDHLTNILASMKFGIWFSMLN